MASNEVTSDQGICCFCKCKRENLVAAGTLYATKTKTQIDHVKNMTASWIETTKVLQDENLLIQISHRDVASNKMYYINPILNVATKNVENNIKNLHRKMVQDAFIEQSYSLHKRSGKQKSRAYF